MHVGMIFQSPQNVTDADLAFLAFFRPWYELQRYKSLVIWAFLQVFEVVLSDKPGFNEKKFKNFLKIFGGGNNFGRGWVIIFLYGEILKFSRISTGNVIKTCF